MLAGSHAGRIANQLHNLNRRATLQIEQQQTNGIKINHVNVNNNKSLGGIRESLSKSLDDKLISPRHKDNDNNPLTETERRGFDGTRDKHQHKYNEEEETLTEGDEENEDEKYNPYSAAVLEIKK